MSIKIVTDSTSYISQDYIDKYDIKIVSLNVTMNEKSYRELDIENDDFYEEVISSKEVPKSSQPILEEVLSTFKDIVKDGDDVVGIFLSSKMSGTYSSAIMIKNMILEDYPNAKIEILDSKTNCMQMGFAAVEAARAASEGKDMKEVVHRASHVINNSRFLFTPETLQYLKKGGRIGGAAALIGNVLQIKPILTVVDGETAVFKKVRTKKKAVEEIAKAVLNDIEDRGLGDIVVHHINCEEEGRKLAQVLEMKLKRTVKIQSIGPVIGLHVGPGSIGIAYYTK